MGEVKKFFIEKLKNFKNYDIWTIQIRALFI